MKNKLTLIMLLMTIVICNAQTSPGVTTKTKVQTMSTVRKNAVKTNLLFEGDTVWQTNAGAYFVIRLSKKTGNPYRKPLVYTKCINQPIPTIKVKTVKYYSKNQTSNQTTFKPVVFKIKPYVMPKRYYSGSQVVRNPYKLKVTIVKP